MAEALGLAAGVAGIISLSITVFQKCVTGIQFISAARQFGSDADRLRSILEYEQFRLLSWGDRAGLTSDRAQRNPQLNWTLIYELLKQLDSLLNDAETLKSRYNLDTELVKDQSLQIQEAHSNKSKSLTKIWSHVRADIINARASIIQDKTTAAKTLRWVAFDSAKMKELLGNIGYFNTCLNEMLASIDRDFIQATLSSLLRTIISRSGQSSDIDVVKAFIDPDSLADASSIDAAASIKQVSLYLSESQTQTHSSGAARPKLKLSKLKLQWFAPYGVLDPNGRQMGIYDFSKRMVKSEVLLEWKRVEKAVEKKLERRIQELTSLMSSISDGSFHSLKCLGYLKRDNDDLSYNEYAYVFEIEDLNTPSRLESLRSRLDTLTFLLNAGGMPPTLSRRVKWAKSLAETVLQLHTSGWLHKSILPQNVLFVSTSESTPADSQSPDRPSRDLRGPYLAGYEFARADNPLEMTEDVPISPFLDLYRHPNAQGPARESFSKIFDLYALGCLLLEIALWEPLPQILMNIETQDKPDRTVDRSTPISASEQKHLDMTLALEAKKRLSSTDTIRTFLDKVGSCAGDVFADAVLLCFHPTSSKEALVEGSGDEDEDDSEMSIEVQLAIVEKLAQINC